MNSIQLFRTDSFINALKAFFVELSVPVNYFGDLPASPQQILGEKYNTDNNTHQLIDDIYVLGMVDDAAFRTDAMFGVSTLDDAKKLTKDYDGILIFGVTIKSDNPTRTQLSEITRLLNRAFPHTPVTVVYKYANLISFANAERTKYTQEWREGEKIGKVSLLKDIDVINTHTGHLRILNDIRVEKTGKNAVTKFEELYSFWQRVFSTDVLTEKFYKELSNWYAWAISQVEFPNDVLITNPQDKIKHNSPNVIRLLTRTLFVWFMKHKGLIPNELFDEKYLKDNLLKGFDPHHQSGLFLEKNKDSIYYKAILQNLFFATLNCPISSLSKEDSRERAFRKSDNYGQHQDVNHLLRYEKHFKNPQLFLDLVNSKVPFLNGGLFDCLDAKSANPPLWIDGFSDNLKSVQKLVFPDFLFFGETENGKNVDLTWFYGEDEKKPKKVIATVKGLFNILESYYFTVEENTPYEQEVSLDPELLGKVFENLLASFNPETKSSARKQTGSFYTPREIVQYMVDESLIAYLKNVVGDDKEEELRTLISYSEKPVAFTTAEKESIIKALFICKILDPACGSGAFPMGILQKMVHILRKLDDKNTFWRKIVEENAKTESIDALTDTENDKEELLRSIGETFDKNINYPDYARKLYLIENCIYGVDIQPIAVQISKLRFFISLVVEQQPNNDPNFGIKPLPNLEAKFVAANTLIGIGKKDATLFDSQIIKLKEEQLRKFNHKIYSAGSPKTKTKYKEKIKELRLEIANELEDIGAVGNAEAHLLTSWDMFNQNASSPFFDPEWMFGIKEGFDVVIGNPPYVSAPSMVENNPKGRQAIIDSKRFNTLFQKWDLYIPFMELGIQLLSYRGVFTMIIPYPFTNQTYAKKLRELIVNQCNLIELVDLNGTKIFENATVSNCIPILSKTKISERRSCGISHINNQKQINRSFSKTLSDLVQDENTTVWNLSGDKTANSHSALNNLGDFCYISKGMVLNADEKTAKGEFSKDDLISDTYDKIHCRKYIEAKDIEKYRVKKIRYLEYNTERCPNKLSRPTFRELYDKPKLMFNRLGNLMVYFDDETQFLHSDSMYSAVLWKDLNKVENKSISASVTRYSRYSRKDMELYSENIQLKYLLGLLNSKYASVLLSNIRGGDYHIYPEHLRNLPIPVVSENQQEKIISFVNQILLEKPEDYENGRFTPELKIDELVYKLYDLTYDEVQVVEDGKFWLSKEDYAKISVE